MPLENSIMVQALALGEGGVRVAIKDSMDVAGVPTRMGSAVFASAPPAARNADVVQALLAGGGQIIGKANMHELAYGVTGVNAWTGTPLNPGWPKLIPGGSSSGSAAAVASGIADVALGTDTGGSIRMPAACCGVIGLKPTFGRVSRGGVHPAQSSLDCVGPMARVMPLIEYAMETIDPTFRSTPEPAAPTLGVVEVDAEPQVLSAVGCALAALNFSARPIRLPSFDQAFEAALAVIGAETWAAYGVHFENPAMGSDVRGRLEAARGVTASQIAAAEQVRATFRAEVDASLEDVDALVLPTLPQTPPRLDAALDARAFISITALMRPFNLSGHPALTLPIATTTGLPVGLQLVGRLGGDEALCALGRRVSRLLNFDHPYSVEAVSQ